MYNDNLKEIGSDVRALEEAYKQRGINCFSDYYNVCYNSDNSV